LTIVGGFANFICIPSDDAVLVPEGLDPVAAQCLPFDYVVAYQMLHRSVAIQSDATVLIQGAAGSTGSALLQLGASMGLKMYGTASTRKLGIVKELGGVPIDYTEEDFVEVLRQKEPGGIDVVFDGVGQTLSRSYSVLNQNGIVVAYGHAPVVSGGKRDWEEAAGNASTIRLGVFTGSFVVTKSGTL